MQNTTIPSASHAMMQSPAAPVSGHVPPAQPIPDDFPQHPLQRPSLRQIVYGGIEQNDGKFNATTVTHVTFGYFESHIDRDGNLVKLSPRDSAILRALITGTRQSKLHVIELIAEEHGIQLDEADRLIFDDLLNPNAHDQLLTGLGIDPTKVKAQKRRGPLDRTKFYQETRL